MTIPRKKIEMRIPLDSLYELPSVFQRALNNCQERPTDYGLGEDFTGFMYHHEATLLLKPLEVRYQPRYSENTFVAIVEIEYNDD